MIEDAVIDCIDLSDTKYTIKELAEYIGTEMDEIPETVEAIIREMLEQDRLALTRSEDGDMVLVVA